MKHKDKVAIVTGGVRDIGRAVSLRLAASGARVAVNYYNNADNGQKVVDEITASGGSAILVQGDMTQSADVEQVVRQTTEAFGDTIHLGMRTDDKDGVAIRDDEYLRPFGNNANGAFGQMFVAHPPRHP